MRTFSVGVMRILLAAALTVVTFLGIAQFVPPNTYVHDLFLERGILQYATTFFFWLATLLIAVQHLALIRERRAFEAGQRVLGGDALDASFIWSDADRVDSGFTTPELVPFQSSLTFSRIRTALVRLRKTKSTKAIEDYFRNRSDVDAAELETEYAIIRYLLWLIPTIGFIGTVVGFGTGISGFSQILDSAERFGQVKEFLPTVTGNLGLAFDSTLLALALSAIVFFYMSTLLKRQENLLSLIDHLCFDEVCALFQEHSSSTEAMIQAIKQASDRMLDATNGNRAEIVRVVRQSLPALIAEELKPELLALRGSEEESASLNDLRAALRAVAEQHGLVAEQLRGLIATLETRGHSSHPGS